MAKAVYRNPGEVLNFTNSGETKIEPGDIVAVGSHIGVAGGVIPAGETGSVHVVGVFAMPKTASLAIAQGDAVYFSTSTNKITKTSTDVPAGWAAEAAAEADDTVYVKLGFIEYVEVEVESDPVPGAG